MRKLVAYIKSLRYNPSKVEASVANPGTGVFEIHHTFASSSQFASKTKVCMFNFSLVFWTYLRLFGTDAGYPISR